MKNKPPLVVFSGDHWKSTPAWLVVFCLFLFLSSCSKEDFNFDKMTDPEWNPTWSMPLIHSNMTLRNIMKKGGTIFVEDPLTHQ